MFDFEKLDVYQKARTLRKALKPVFTHIKDRSVRDQLQRASLSIVLNLAEGTGKHSKKEKANFYSISRASTYESAAIVIEIMDDGIINVETFNNVYFRLEEISKMLTGLINALDRSATKYSN